MRIVSLLPSATEMVCALGLEHWLCGVSHQCDFPNSIRSLTRVTRCRIPDQATSGEIDALVRQCAQAQLPLYWLDKEWLAELCPDLILTQSLCGVCAIADDEVMAIANGLPKKPIVLNLQADSLAGVYHSMRMIGEITGHLSAAESAIATLKQRVENVNTRASRASQPSDMTTTKRPRVLVLEWIDPPFTAGHWTPELVAIAGGQEVLGISGQRSQTTRWQSILQSDPEFMLIACCGLDVPRTKRDLPLPNPIDGLDQLSCVRNRRVFAVDGSSLFSRPGPRLVDSLEVLAHAIDPQTHPLPPNLIDHAAVAVDLIRRQ
jgi:iron complex transport system substrate-binding protein